ncbi:hypothetical protein DAPPUDRAFT_238315 [Daphnia pulex]|uniref:Uncharacterized protein n=1 Tax=Daphnia pulex TaxID=6669 RepID=E9G640_DAPPU|nr:hypothetical protein DAPPUDRAFT_238315 [Daphnia pulex]|eukprot:EFX85059.1 hypothetical protein DAPPUDRAFT_238315 [Daphnia pulex]
MYGKFNRFAGGSHSYNQESRNQVLTRFRLQSKTTTPKCIQGLPPKSALKIFLLVVGDQLGSWLMVADCISTKLSFLAAVLLLPSSWQTGYENNLAYSPLLNSPQKIEQTISPFSLNIIKKKRNGHLPKFPEFSSYNGPVCLILANILLTPYLKLSKEPLDVLSVRGIEQFFRDSAGRVLRMIRLLFHFLEPATRFIVCPKTVPTHNAICWHDLKQEAQRRNNRTTNTIYDLNICRRRVRLSRVSLIFQCSQFTRHRRPTFRIYMSAGRECECENGRGGDDGQAQRRGKNEDGPTDSRPTATRRGWPPLGTIKGPHLDDQFSSLWLDDLFAFGWKWHQDKTQQTNKRDEDNVVARSGKPKQTQTMKVVSSSRPTSIPLVIRTSSIQPSTTTEQRGRGSVALS